MYYRYFPMHNMQTTPMVQRGVELARAYIPYQYYTNSFSPMEALEHGTMFPELVRLYAPNEERGSYCYE